MVELDLNLTDRVQGTTGRYQADEGGLGKGCLFTEDEVVGGFGLNLAGAAHSRERGNFAVGTRW